MLAEHPGHFVVPGPDRHRHAGRGRDPLESLRGQLARPPVRQRRLGGTRSQLLQEGSRVPGPAQPLVKTRQLPRRQGRHVRTLAPPELPQMNVAPVGSFPFSRSPASRKRAASTSGMEPEQPHDVRGNAGTSAAASAAPGRPPRPASMLGVELLRKPGQPVGEPDVLPRRLVAVDDHPGPGGGCRVSDRASHAPTNFLRARPVGMEPDLASVVGPRGRRGKLLSSSRASSCAVRSPEARVRCFHIRRMSRQLADEIGFLRVSTFRAASTAMSSGRWSCRHSYPPAAGAGAKGLVFASFSKVSSGWSGSQYDELLR